jgi:hypothetical protein
VGDVEAPSAQGLADRASHLARLVERRLERQSRKAATEDAGQAPGEASGHGQDPLAEVGDVVLAWHRFRPIREADERDAVASRQEPQLVVCPYAVSLGKAAGRAGGQEQDSQRRERRWMLRPTVRLEPSA